jgi:hypothetical protein
VFWYFTFSGLVRRLNSNNMVNSESTVFGISDLILTLMMTLMTLITMIQTAE